MFLGEHGDPFSGIRQCYILRGTNHNSSIDGQGLHDAQMNVPRSWRQIDEQKVQLTPGGIKNHLIQCFRSHGTPPNDSLIGLRIKSDGQYFDAVLFYGRHLALTLYLHR